MGGQVGSPAVADGVIYVSSYVDDDARLYAVDAISGQQRWTFDSVDTPMVVDGVVYASSDDSLYAIDAESGQQRGIAAEGRFFNSSPVVINGTVYMGRGDNLYAIDAISGQQHWMFTTTGGYAGPSLPYPVVADETIYVGGLDRNLYAIDIETGQELWNFTAVGPIQSAPAIVDGVVYVGSWDGSLYAIGNLSLEGQTAITEAASTTTAQIDVTPTAVAAAVATHQALEDSWNAYFQTELPAALGTVTNALSGLSMGEIDPAPSDPYLATDYNRGASYDFSIVGGSASAWVALTIFPFSDDADTALQNLSGGLLRSGWQTADVKLDHDHACLTVVHGETSEAVCYLTRHDALIVSHSDVSLPSPDAALLNATDLARSMSEAYDQVDRPDR